MKTLLYKSHLATKSPSSFRFIYFGCNDCEKESASKEFIKQKQALDKSLVEQINYKLDRIKCSEDAKNSKVYERALKRIDKDKNLTKNQQERLTMILSPEEEACLRRDIAKLQAARDELNRDVKTAEAMADFEACYGLERFSENKNAEAVAKTQQELLYTDMEVSGCGCDAKPTEPPVKKPTPNCAEKDNRYCDNEEIPSADQDSEPANNQGEKTRTRSEKITIYETASGAIDLNNPAMNSETLSKVPIGRSYLKYLIKKYIDQDESLANVFDTNEQFQRSDAKSGQVYKYKEGPKYELSQREKNLAALALFRAKTQELSSTITALSDGNPNITKEDMYDSTVYSFVDYGKARTPGEHKVEATKYQITVNDDGRVSMLVTQDALKKVAGYDVDLNDEYNYTLEEADELGRMNLTETNPYLDGRSNKSSSFAINSKFENQKTKRMESGERFVSKKIEKIYAALARAQDYAGDKVDV